MTTLDHTEVYWRPPGRHRAPDPPAPVPPGPLVIAARIVLDSALWLAMLGAGLMLIDSIL